MCESAEVVRSLVRCAIYGRAHRGAQRHRAWGERTSSGRDERWGQEEEEEANTVVRMDKVKKE